MRLQQIINKTLPEILQPVINEQFGTNIKLAEFKLYNVMATEDVGLGYDTKAVMEITDKDSPYSGTRNVFYKRLDAEALWTGVPKYLPVAANEVDEYTVAGKLNEIYGLTLDVTHIKTASVVGSKVEVVFNDISPIIKGKISFSFNASAIDLDQYVSKTALNGLWPQYFIDGKRDASLYSYRWDCTSLAPTINNLHEGDFVTNKVVSLLRDITGDDWKLSSAGIADFNLNGAYISYIGSTTLANKKGYPTNTNYVRCAIIILTDQCKNMAGGLVINMNS